MTRLMQQRNQRQRQIHKPRMQKHKRLRATQGLFQRRFQTGGTAGTEELIAEGEHASVALVGLNVEGGGEGKHVGFGRAVDDAPQALFLDDELGEGGDVHALGRRGEEEKWWVCVGEWVEWGSLSLYLPLEPTILHHVSTFH